jgi:hypothetical protein
MLPTKRMIARAITIDAVMAMVGDDHKNCTL